VQNRRRIRRYGDLLFERAEARLMNRDEVIACGNCGKTKRSIAIGLRALRSVGCGGFEGDLCSGNGAMLRVVNDAFNLAKNGSVYSLAQKQAGEKKKQCSSAHTAEASFM
jgi:ferredoxin